MDLSMGFKDQTKFSVCVLFVFFQSISLVFYVI